MSLRASWALIRIKVGPSKRRGKSPICVGGVQSRQQQETMSRKSRLQQETMSRKYYFGGNKEKEQTQPLDPECGDMVKLLPSDAAWWVAIQANISSQWNIFFFPNYLFSDKLISQPFPFRRNSGYGSRLIGKLQST